MTDEVKHDVPALVRKHKLPEWYIDHNGKQRLQSGRWNPPRVAEFLESNPSWQTLDDLARVVYGTTSKKNRDNVRKHIPTQRRFMLNSLEKPIVTEYSERGRIMRVKFFNQTDVNDRVKLKMELDRARERKELSEHRYETLLNFFFLPVSTSGVEQSPDATTDSVVAKVS